MNKLIEQLETAEHDVIDVINEWDDFIERHKPHFSPQEYTSLIKENDLAYQEAIQNETEVAA
jgi:hypothetical protein